MSHECPTCYQQCYCDGEDSRAVSDEWIHAHCEHACEPETDDDAPDAACPTPGCTGRGPDWADQGADPAASVPLSCPTCGVMPEGGR